jgi:hypothetical protein
MKKIKLMLGILLVCTTILIVANTCAQKTENKSDPEKNGYVPNAETAIKIAEAIWLPIYGDNIYNNGPFKATLKNNQIWIVEGTLHTDKGGVPYAEIQKKDCKIINVTHGK